MVASEYPCVPSFCVSTNSGGIAQIDRFEPRIIRLGMRQTCETAFRLRWNGSRWYGAMGGQETERISILLHTFTTLVAGLTLLVIVSFVVTHFHPSSSTR